MIDSSHFAMMTKVFFFCTIESHLSLSLRAHKMFFRLENSLIYGAYYLVAIAILRQVTKCHLNLMKLFCTIWFFKTFFKRPELFYDGTALHNNQPLIRFFIMVLIFCN